MKSVNCATVLALVAGSIAVATPASAAELSLSPNSIVASHDVLHMVDMTGDSIFGPLSQQQNNQQQQQQVVQNLAPIAGTIYTAGSNGFEV